MKKVFSALLLFAAISLLNGCKKDGDKDHASAIKDKTWIGTFNYRGETEQYYSIDFKADGTLMFNQATGDFPGTWAINGSQLSIFIGSEIKTTITGDNMIGS